MDDLSGEMPSRRCTACEGGVSADKYSLFEEFSQSAIRRLGIEPAQDISFLKVWSEVEPFNVCISCITYLFLHIEYAIYLSIF